MTKRQCVNPFLFIRTHKVRGKGRKVEGVGVVKDKRVKLDEMNVSHTRLISAEMNVYSHAASRTSSTTTT
jgi:hypothetical protein